MILPPIIVLYGLILQLDQAIHGPDRVPLPRFEMLAKAIAQIGNIALSFNLCVFISADHEIIVMVYVDNFTTAESRSDF